MRIASSDKEKLTLKKALWGFICRVSDFEGKRLPEEIAILPAMTQVLLDHSFPLDEKEEDESLINI